MHELDEHWWRTGPRISGKHSEIHREGWQVSYYKKTQFCVSWVQMTVENQLTCLDAKETKGSNYAWGYAAARHRY